MSGPPHSERFHPWSLDETEATEEQVHRARLYVAGMREPEFVEDRQDAHEILDALGLL